MTAAPSLLTFPQPPLGLAWQSIAIDRSQATIGGGFNLSTISRGNGGEVGAVTRWSAKQGIGPESAALFDGIVCNAIGAISWRALSYSIPLRILEANSGAVSNFSDIVRIDCLCGGGGGVATGLFLMQTDGTIAGTFAPAAGTGFGWQVSAGNYSAWTSLGGAIAVAGGFSPSSLHALTLVVRYPRLGQAGVIQWAVDGVPLVTRSIVASVGAGPNQGYQPGKSSFWPILSCDMATLNVADFSILNLSAGQI